MFLFQQLRSIRETTSQTPDQASQTNRPTQHDHRNVCKTFILTSPHSKCTHTHNTQTEIDRAVFAYSSDVNAKNF